MSHYEILERKGIPFSYQVNNKSHKIKSVLGTYYATDTLIPRKELGFIKAVKHYIIKNGLHESIPNRLGDDFRNKIEYYKYANYGKTRVYDDRVFEVDITKAYWNTADKLGILSKELYDRGLKVRKKTRLAALGSLAKKTDVYESDGKEVVYMYTETQEQTEFLWFTICKNLGKTMDKARKAIGENFIFYWVDGIFVVGKKAANRAQKSFKESGFESTIEPIELIKFNKNKGNVKIVGKGEERDYPLPRKYANKY